MAGKSLSRAVLPVQLARARAKAKKRADGFSVSEFPNITVVHYLLHVSIQSHSVRPSAHMYASTVAKSCRGQRFAGEFSVIFAWLLSLFDRQTDRVADTRTHIKWLCI